MLIVAFLFNYTAEIDTRAYYILNTQQGITPGGGETICPSPMAVRRWQKIAADLRPSADRSGVSTSLVDGGG